MKKQIIALILLIPILLIFTIFSTAGTYSLFIKVATGGIELDYTLNDNYNVGDGFVVLDMSDKSQELKLNPTVLPINATNKEFTYKTTAIDNQPQGEVKIDDKGVVTPTKVGKLYITATTADGGFSDKISVEIILSKPNRLSVSANEQEVFNSIDIELCVGSVALTISTDSTEATKDYIYTSLVRWQWKNGIKWEKMENCLILSPNVASVGVFKLNAVGEVTLRATLDGEHTASGEQLYKEVTINVINTMTDKEFVVVEDSALAGDPTKPLEKTLTVTNNKSSFSILINADEWTKYYNAPAQGVNFVVGAATTSSIKEQIESTLSKNAIYDREKLKVSFTYDALSSRLTVDVEFIDNTAASVALALPLFDKTLDIAVNNLKIGADSFTWMKGKTAIEAVDGKYSVYSSIKDGHAVLSIVASLFEFSGAIAFTSSSPQVASINVASAGTVVLLIGQIGATTITATMTLQDDAGKDYTVSKTIELNVVKIPTLNFKEKNNIYGLANQLVVGEYYYDANYTPSSYNYQMQAIVDPMDCQLVWTTSDKAIATVDKKGVVTVVNNGVVTITATSQDSILVGEKPAKSASFKIKCVKDAVNISTYPQLLKATATGKKVVLLNSLGSDEDIYEYTYIEENNKQVLVFTPDKDGNYIRKAGNTTQPFYMYKEGVDSLAIGRNYKWYSFDLKDANKVVAYTTQKATSDLTYLNNPKPGDQSFASKQDVNVAITFTKDIYGNGYFINADSIAKCRFDGTGAPMLTYDGSNGAKIPVPFNGAVVFVAVSMGDTYAVYGQDNIAFYVKGNDITVDNIQLQNLNDGVSDLAVLDYCGTTVEVNGERNQITYSRLKLGKTVLRVFSGNANDFNDDSRTSLTVSNSILGQSREFTVRIGANKVQKWGETADTSKLNCGPTLGGYLNPTRFGEVVDPTIPGGKTKYKSVDEYNAVLLKDEDYLRDYIRTTVTIQDCVLEKNGLFGIAVDSQFAGWYLNNKGDGFGWKNCAGTSYGSVLTLKGQVRMYDWKDITSINSGSLVGLNSDEFPDPFGLTSMISSFKDLVITRSETIPGVKDPVVVNYVHGGIAFFGGGRNYSLFDNQCTDNKYKLTNVGMTVGFQGLKITGGIQVITDRLLRCAGDDMFRFYMFGNESAFRLDDQEADIKGNNVYDWLQKK